ncbi:MAG: multiprotein bridging factor aMBF1 [Candidatus Thermoplasmatota archaeon]|jgi:putative transcription factor|nr:multiprotein bridging factor aMBF1 [Candidatus Thermoplasmatota archaeon]
MADCERCGKKGRLTLVEIAGARLYVCQDCGKHGKPVQEPRPIVPAYTSKTSSRAPVPKPDAMTNRELELADDFNVRIQRARERKGWSREDLGKKMSERVSIISKLENGEMRPSDDLIRKLERTLDIKLMEPVSDVRVQGSSASQGLTLGDLITRKRA